MDQHYNEIERKWIVGTDDGNKLIEQSAGCFDIQQGYFNKLSRVRINRGTTASSVISVKLPISTLTRAEYNYNIPVVEAEQIMLHLPNLVKRRHDIGNGFTLDQFFGKLFGFFMIEKEYTSEEQALADVIPGEWNAEDVTDDEAYTNGNLVIMSWDHRLGLFKNDDEVDDAPLEDYEHLIVTGDVDDNMPAALIIK